VELTGANAEGTILSRTGPAKTLETATSIRITTGANVDFGYGTVHFTGGLGIYMNTGTADVVADGAKKLALTKAAGVKASVEVALNSRYTVRSVGEAGAHTSELPFLVRAHSVLDIQTGITMSVTGTHPKPPGQPEFPTNVSVYLTGSNYPAYPPPTTRLAGGSTLEVTGEHRQEDGCFFVMVVTTDGSVATLKGKMVITGTQTTGEVRFERNGNNFGTLKVDGDVGWVAGSYRPSVGVVSGVLKACLWQITGKLTHLPAVGANAIAAPDVLGAPAQNSEWVIVEAAGGIQVDQLPPAAPGFPVNDYTYERVPPMPGQPVKQWKLKKL
jgi:hypothetical protein